MRRREPEISGFVKPGFEEVYEVFVENFQHHQEIGAACCIYYRGEKVVDIWGGVRTPGTKEPWEQDTMVIVFSTTKGLSALAMALAHSRGLFDYDDSISKYWPEFAQLGKDKITIRQLLAHQAGLFAFDELGDKSIIADLDRLAGVLARQKPAHKPGKQQVYHALSLGYYQNEIMRRTDPKGRTIGQYFQDEIATPLGLDFYIRLPEEIPNSKLATIQQQKMNVADMFRLPIPFLLAVINPHSSLRRALLGSQISLDDDRIYARNFEVPSGGGVGTARAIAKAYSVFATGGKELGLKKKTISELIAPPIAPLKGYYDWEMPFSLGFAKPSRKDPFGSSSSFGMPGSGGSFGFADPEAELGYGYVPNGMSMALEDPRDRALRNAMYHSLG